MERIYNNDRTISFQQINPPDYLKNYVQYFWTLESYRSDPFLKTLGPLADGCPGIIFQQTESGKFYDQDNKELPQIFLYGQTVKRTELKLIGNFKTLGVSLFPNALKSIFGFNANELTDTCLDLKLVSLTVAEQLVNAISAVEKINIFSSYLFNLINKNNSLAEPVTQYALTQIIQSKGEISLKQLQKTLTLSERTLERKFEKYVGVSPKLYSRICRFQASLQQIKNNDYSKLTDIAYENGYADQSHFIRSFKEFAGCSPLEYQKKSSEILRVSLF